MYEAITIFIYLKEISFEEAILFVPMHIKPHLYVCTQNQIKIL